MQSMKLLKKKQKSNQLKNKNNMKKLFTLLLLCFTLSTFAQTPKYPFGAATVTALTVDNDTLTPTISNSMTYLTASDTLVGNTVIYATISDGVKAGDKLFIKALNGYAARTLTFKSTYFIAPSITTTRLKTRLYSFVYDGSKFVLIANTQVD
jgi:hypothetical protein